MGMMMTWKEKVEELQGLGCTNACAQELGYKGLLQLVKDVHDDVWTQLFFQNDKTGTIVEINKWEFMALDAMVCSETVDTDGIHSYLYNHHEDEGEWNEV